MRVRREKRDGGNGNAGMICPPIANVVVVTVPTLHPRFSLVKTLLIFRILPDSAGKVRPFDCRVRAEPGVFTPTPGGNPCGRDAHVLDCAQTNNQRSAFPPASSLTGACRKTTEPVD